MTSISAKVLDLNKNSFIKQGNGLLTTSTGITDKIASKSTFFKSPPASKFTSKTSLLKNYSFPKKMDASSPPKVAVTSPACEMNNAASKTLEYHKSQGDGLNMIPVKNNVDPNNRLVHSNGSSDVLITMESHIEENHFAAKSSKVVNDEERKTGADSVATDTIDNTVRGDSVSSDVQRCASGDQGLIREKSEFGEFEPNLPNGNTKNEHTTVDVDNDTHSNVLKNSTGEYSVEAAKLISGKEITKNSIRMKVWEYLENKDLVLFPRPCKGRLPNFKGASVAADKLITLNIFKNSKIIMVNPDKPQEMVRFHILSFGKRLLVPVPSLRDGLFHAVMPPSEASKQQLVGASQRYGMKKWSKLVTATDCFVDMIVVGSVAVDRKGHRIGKGRGFADLEFAIMAQLNAINEDTVIVTTVHDDQIYDELPNHLFSAYDVPVDWIITPTQVIKIMNKLPRPNGIIWNILSNRRISQIPLLLKLKEEEQSRGVECTLKEEDSDVEESSLQRFTKRHQYNKFNRSTGDPMRDNKMPVQPRLPQQTYYNRPSRFFQPPPNRVYSYGPPVMRNDYVPPQQRMYYQKAMYNGRAQQPIHETRGRSLNRNNRSTVSRPQSMDRSRSGQSNRARSMNRSKSMSRAVVVRRPSSDQFSNRQQSNNQIPMRTATRSVEVQTVDEKSKASRAYLKRKRAQIEFSIRLKNIGMGVRVRDLKIALNEKGIKPRDITWRGYKGFAVLHFVKQGCKENHQFLNVDDVIKTLKDLPLPPKDKKPLIIEPIHLNKMNSNETSKQFNETITEPASLAV